MNNQFEDSEVRPSRVLLDQMMVDCALNEDQKKKMHSSLAGVFGGNTPLYTGLTNNPQSAEENCRRVKDNWKDKAHWKNLSYHQLFQHERLDEYIKMRVAEIRAKRIKDEQENKSNP